MEDKRIGCDSNKTILVDPNTFYGHNQLTNMSVPLEDLSISVQLTTSTKARTVLTSSGNGNINSSSTAKAISVTFIEGSSIGGKNSLTTNYTDLTTTFDDGNNGESLGISNIEIDFNSSYAPLITINFIDIRGAAIFQNEGNVTENANKYSSFFQLPYPMYTLTIKGYYGLPVTYELHMTKFSAKFNSQTGNFEITGSFIGYTYAMLSDMLLGYLKAIPYTNLGSSKYGTMKETNPGLITLDELMKAVSKVDAEAEKIKSSDEGVAQLAKGEQKDTELDLIFGQILTFAQQIDISFNSSENSDKTEYQYIVQDPTKKSDEITSATTEYFTSIKSAINVFNTDNKITLKEEDFTTKLIKPYKDLTPLLLTKTDKESTDKLKLIFGNANFTQEEFDDTRRQLLSLSKNYNISDGANFTVHDFREQYRILRETKKEIADEVLNLKKSVGQSLKLAIKSELGIDPTVRNVIEVFTSAVEVFMSVIFDVSKSAIGANKEVREIQLRKYINKDNSYDIKKEHLNPPAGLAPIYFPWPEYREDSGEGLVEKYLGELNVLDIPKDVDELLFIDDLLQAFLKSKKETDAVINNSIQDTTNWVPANPLDTRLFLKDFPYKRINGNTKEDIINMVITRAFIYMGISNYKLTPDEIKAMAEVEANAVLSDIPNKNVLLMLSQLKDSDFYTSKATNHGKELLMMKPLADSERNNVDSWYYNFILGIPSPMAGHNTSNDTKDARLLRVLPLGTSNGKFEYDFIDNNLKNNLVEEASLGSVFLTNYSTTTFLNPGQPPHLLTKPFDGGVYVKIFSTTSTPSIYDFKSNAKQIPVVTATQNVLDFSVLSKNQADFNDNSTGVGFSQFGGSYGIQEYSKINLGVGLEDVPFSIMFFANGNHSSRQKPKTSAFASKRIEGKKTEYDIGEYSIKTAEESCASWPCDNAFDNIIFSLVDEDENATRERIGQNREALAALVKQDTNVSFPFISFQVAADTNDSNVGDSDDSAIVGLFGSRFYYEQISSYSKAFLFLHTLPWTGLFKTKETETSSFNPTANGESPGIFGTNEILNTFGNRAGFISAPRLWVAFVGGLLWRADSGRMIYSDGSSSRTFISNKIQISGGSGSIDPILWNNGGVSFIPTYGIGTRTPLRNQYITAENDTDFQQSSMTFPGDRFLLDLHNKGFKDIEDILLALPDQVKDEFKKSFFDFVSKEDSESDWELLKHKLEVIKGTGSDWTTAWDDMMKSESIGGAITEAVTDGDAAKSAYLKTYFVKAKLNATNNGKLVFDNYIIFTPYYDESRFRYNFATELKDDSDAVTQLLKSLSEEVIIMNTNYNIWQFELSKHNHFDSQMRRGVYVGKDDMKLYIDSFLVKLKPTDSEKSAANEEKKSDLIEIFGTDNENLIKLQLYRTCKNIYDKWVAGSESEDKVIFKNGNKSRNGLDKHLAKLAADKSGTPSRENELRLIDSFRFVDRSFKDIGDLLYVNPIPVNNYLTTNPNSSFYDCVTDLLSSNNFDFIPLPNYINYGDPNELASMFKPTPTKDSIGAGNTGPSFVCVYVGQTSKSLDFNNSAYPNDGVTFKCDKNGSLSPTAPKDFVGVQNKPYENKVAVFAVNYGQQNQNIFKDITLDQNEFTETAESLQIIDDIANKGGENKKSFGGQNMYNVYSVRSYKTEVEMMGNAMIQPMMYFQLNNIPMFHGAYMITHVKHSIKPNNMSTHFTGVRIRSVLTPLLDASDLFMSLVDSIDAGSTAQSNNAFGSITTTGKVAPIIATMIENGSSWGNIVSGNISTKLIPEIAGIQNLKLSSPKENILLAEAADSLVPMLTDWVDWMKANGFKGLNGKYAYITSVFRDYQKSLELYNTLPKGQAARPGRGNHGWCIAVDLQLFTKDGVIIRNLPNIKKSFDINYNEALKWLLENSYMYGWISPFSLRDNVPVEEHWHYEYHGTAAACLYSQHPTTYGFTSSVDKPQKSFVLNPKDKKGDRAIYENCDSIDTKDNGDGVELTLGGESDFWSLISIASLEAGSPQARADVAQSIYNRLATPKQPYGHSIKEIVTAKGQYEPTFKNRSEWLLIRDEKTAINAVKNSKGWNEAQAKKALKETKEALFNSTLQNDSKTFVQTRTEFLAEKPSSKNAIGVIERSQKGNNAFYWQYAGKVLIDKPVPTPPTWDGVKTDIA